MKQDPKVAENDEQHDKRYLAQSSSCCPAAVESRGCQTAARSAELCLQLGKQGKYRNGQLLAGSSRH